MKYIYIKSIISTLEFVGNLVSILFNIEICWEFSIYFTKHVHNSQVTTLNLKYNNNALHSVTKI
jgi:hypothetical protein